jgi:mRNA interferase HigB
MRIIAKRTLVEFWEKNPEYRDARGQLEAWYGEVKSAAWRKPTDVKERYRNSSIIKSGRVVFNICGNKYRLVVKINYPAQIVFIRFIGTHEEYDTINAEEV